MRDPLLNNTFGFHFRSSNLSAFPFSGWDDFQLRLVYSQRIGMDRCLGDEAIRKRDPDDTRDESRASDKEEIPVETTWFLRRILLRLGSETTYVLYLASE